MSEEAAGLAPSEKAHHLGPETAYPQEKRA